MDKPSLGGQALVELSIPNGGIVFDGLVLRLPTTADLKWMPPAFAEPVTTRSSPPSSTPWRPAGGGGGTGDGTGDDGDCCG